MTGKNIILNFVPATFPYLNIEHSLSNKTNTTIKETNSISDWYSASVLQGRQQELAIAD